MENASKGLLIAAAVLIVIMLVTIGIKVLSPTKDIIEDGENVGSSIKTSTQSAVSKFQAAIGSKKGTMDGTIVEEEDNQIKIGDYVNYKSDKGESDLKWRVLGRNSSGQLELISATPTKEILTLSGEDGYNKAISELDKMCSVYGKGKNASGARSLRVEDINKVTGVTDFSTVDKDYGTKWQYKFEKEGEQQYRQYASDEKTVIKDWEYTPSWYDIIAFRKVNSNVTLSNSNPGESDIFTYTYYSYEVDDLFKSNENYWLASRNVRCDIIIVQWEIYMVSGKGGKIENGCGYSSNGYEFDGSYALRPVVTLKSNVKLVKNGDGTWDII